MKIVAGSEITAAIERIAVETPTIVVGGNYATPWEVLRLASAARPSLRLFAINCQRGWPDREGIETVTPFIGAGVRSHDRLIYVPSRLSLVPRLYNSSVVPDVVLVQTTTPHQGRVSLGIEVNVLPAAIEAVRARGGLVLAQVNPNMPYTYGDAELDLEDINLALEVDAPLESPPSSALDDHVRTIGTTVASYVSDGSTVQFGIGAVPDAVASELVSRRYLGVWSELISDGVIEMQRAGALDESRQIVTSFIFGSPECYEWADRNPTLLMRRTEVTNDPKLIASIPQMMAVNTAIEVDLHAQVNASYIRGVPYSGFGGQPDFVVGSMHSDGGHAIIALRSWHEKTQTSTVVPLLSSPTTSFQHSVIVSEHGFAEIFGASDRQQSRSIIDNVADPRARDALLDANDTVTAG